MSSSLPLKFFGQLNGVFAVYKNANTGVISLKRTILHKLITDLDAVEYRPQKQMIQFVSAKIAEMGVEDQKPPIENVSLTEANPFAERVPVSAPDWFDHPLVQGSRYNIEDFELTFGQTLDAKASGVQLIGLQSRGSMLLKRLRRFRIPRSYHLHGRFGLANVKFDGEGRVIERSTWDHITEPKISRLLCMIQGVYRNSLIESSNLDLESQHAYEMASKGLLKPEVPTGPMILDLKLAKLDLPDFVIDVTCIDESCQFLRKLMHEIGMELRSSAVCLRVRRYRDALFYADDDSTLLTKEITGQKVADIMAENGKNLDPLLRQKHAVFSESRNVEDDSWNEVGANG